MLKNGNAEQAFRESVSAVTFGFDTFAFRKFYEVGLDKEEQIAIMDFVKEKIPKGTPIYQAVKKQIDEQEFLTTDYYANPYPRKFIGAYAPVVYKTFAGLMAMSLSQQI